MPDSESFVLHNLVIKNIFRVKVSGSFLILFSYFCGILIFLILLKNLVYSLQKTYNISLKLHRNVTIFTDFEVFQRLNQHYFNSISQP